MRVGYVQGFPGEATEAVIMVGCLLPAAHVAVEGMSCAWLFCLRVAIVCDLLYVILDCCGCCHRH